MILCEEVTSLLDLAMESTEMLDNRFAISIETVNSQKTGWYLAKDQDASKALVHAGRLYLRGLWEIICTGRQLAETELKVYLFVAVSGLTLFVDENFTLDLHHVDLLMMVATHPDLYLAPAVLAYTTEGLSSAS